MEPDHFKPETLMFGARPNLSQTEYLDLRQTYVAALADIKLLKKFWNAAAGDWDWTRDGSPIAINADDDTITNNLSIIEAAIVGDVLTFDLPDIDDVTPFTNLDSMNVALAAIVALGKVMKANRLAFKPTYEVPVVTQFDLGTLPYDGNSGAYGAWLGTDGQLWIDYSRLVDIVSGPAIFSLSFPKEKTGTYMWLMKREEDRSGFFVRMPKRSISLPVWMSALLLDMGNLPSNRECTWYVRSDHCNSFIITRLNYIKAAITQGAPVEVFR
jgi:hypothetical protein